MQKELKYTILLTTIYFILIFVGLLHHEISFDEAQAWLIARDSNSIAELFQNLKYEGHPFLWHGLLFIITRFASNPFWMQMIHLLLASGTVFIFLKNAPLNWVFKILFIFGYFMVFEYSLISRSYILGVFLLFLACSWYAEAKNKFLPIALLLTATLFVHLFFSVVAICFFLLMLYENKSVKPAYYKIGIGIFCIGIGFLVYQMIPPSDTLFFISKKEVPFWERIAHSSSFVVKGLINIPDFRLFHFWNTNLIVNYSKMLALVLTLLLSLLPLFLFYKNRKILIFVYSCFLGIFLLFFIARVTGSRFNGVAFMVIIMGLWLNGKTASIPNFSKYASLVFYGILLIHLFSGVYAYSLDIKYPFFNSDSVIEYLKNNKLNKKEIAVISHEGIVLSAQLERKVFFLSRNSYQSFFSSKYDYKPNITPNEVIPLLVKHSEQQRNFIFVSYLKLDEQKADSNLNIKYLSCCKRGVMDGFDVFIYNISKK